MESFDASKYTFSDSDNEDHDIQDTASQSVNSNKKRLFKYIGDENEDNANPPKKMKITFSTHNIQNTNNSNNQHHISNNEIESEDNIQSLPTLLQDLRLCNLDENDKSGEINKLINKMQQLEMQDETNDNSSTIRLEMCETMVKLINKLQMLNKNEINSNKMLCLNKKMNQVVKQLTHLLHKFNQKINTNDVSKEKWYWFCDEGGIKWIPYKDEDQKLINDAWINGKPNVIVMKRFKIDFHRNNKNTVASGQQYNYQIYKSWRRDVIKGVPDDNNMLNDIPCKQHPK